MPKFFILNFLIFIFSIPIYKNQTECSNPLSNPEYFIFFGYKDPNYETTPINSHHSFCNYFNKIDSCCSNITTTKLNLIYNNYKNTLKKRGDSQINDFLNYFSPFFNLNLSNYQSIKINEKLKKLYRKELNILNYTILSIAQSYSNCGSYLLKYLASLLCFTCFQSKEYNLFIDSNSLFIKQENLDKIANNCNPIIYKLQNFAEFSKNQVAKLLKIITDSLDDSNYEEINIKNNDNFILKLKKITGKEINYFINSSNKIDIDYDPMLNLTNEDKNIVKIKDYLLYFSNLYRQSYISYLSFNFSLVSDKIQLDNNICKFITQSYECIICTPNIFQPAEQLNFTDFEIITKDEEFKNDPYSDFINIKKFQKKNFNNICNKIDPIYLNLQNFTQKYPFSSIGFFFEIAAAQIIYKGNGYEDYFVRNFTFPIYREMEILLETENLLFYKKKQYFENMESEILDRFNKYLISQKVIENRTILNNVNDYLKLSYLIERYKTNADQYLFISEFSMYYNYKNILQLLDDSLKKFNDTNKILYKNYSLICIYNSQCLIYPGIKKIDLKANKSEIYKDYDYVTLESNFKCTNDKNCNNYNKTKIIAWCYDSIQCRLCISTNYTLRIPFLCYSKGFPLLNDFNNIYQPNILDMQTNEKFNKIINLYDLYNVNKKIWNVGKIANWFYTEGSNLRFSIMNLKELPYFIDLDTNLILKATNFNFSNPCESINLCNLWNYNEITKKNIIFPSFEIFLTNDIFEENISIFSIENYNKNKGKIRNNIKINDDSIQRTIYDKSYDIEYWSEKMMDSNQLNLIVFNINKNEDINYILNNDLNISFNEVEQNNIKWTLFCVGKFMLLVLFLL